MKFSLFLGCVVVSILVVASGHIFDSTLDEDWKNWKSQYEKQYTEGVEAYRRMIWEDSLRYIKQHNLEHSMGKHTFTVGMNQFGDLTTEEFTKLMNGFLQVKPHNLTKEEVDKDDEDDESDDVRMAATVDWRTHGYVTPVKNQGRCGSCWSFSATGSLEGQWFKKKGKLVPLSEQNLVDCSRQHGTVGCDGGWMTSAFDYVKDNGGINSAATYPYTGKDEDCKFQKDEVAATITGHKLIQPKTEPALAKAVESVGPISVAIDASPKTFQYYNSGVFYDPSCSSLLNHAVLVVGYGNEGGTNYWIVKNSWGADWGDKGYIKMAKDRNNHCGIASDPVYPVV